MYLRPRVRHRHCGLMKVRLLLFLAVFIVTGCGLPYDAEDSFQAAKNGELRVGRLKEDPRAEQFLTEFAEEIGSEIVFFDASPKVLHQGLREAKLHVVYGELDTTSPFLKGVAGSRPYHKAQALVLGGGEELSEEEIRKVGVRVESEEERLHAVLVSGKEPVKTSPYKLITDETGKYESAMKIGDPIEYVLALPPGENRLLVEIDRRLLRRRHDG